MTEKYPNTEMIFLPVSIPGVGRAGDCIVSDPDHPDERYRLTAVRSLDASTLPAIKETVRQWEDGEVTS